MARRPLLLASLLLVAACSDEPTIPEYTSPTAAFDAAMLAVSKPDLKELWLILTPAAKDKVEQGMRAWQLRLRDPKDAAAITADVRARNAAATPKDFYAARDGTVEDVWRFFLLAKPRPAKPKTTGLRLDQREQTAEIGYVDVHGTERVVRLVERRGRWLVDDLPL